MKKVKFLQDFQGRETNERFFLKNTEVELEDHMADLLVKEKRVELVSVPVPVLRDEEVPPLQDEAPQPSEEIPVRNFKRGRK